MKYTLNENAKFFLNEKYILDERFILNEVSVTIYSTIINYIKQILDNIKNDKNADKKNIIKRLISQTNNILNELKNIKDANIIKGHVKAYLNNIEALLKVLDPSFSYQANASDNIAFSVPFKHLYALLNSANSDKETINKIKKEVAEANTIFNELLNNIDEVKIGDTKFSKSEQEIITTKFYRNVLKARGNQEANKNETVINGLNNIYKIITNIDLKGNVKLASFLTEVEKLNNSEFNTFLSKLEIKDTDKLLGKIIDWDAAFKNAPDKNDFWDEYYREVWGPNAEKIRALGPAFRQECEVLGFTNEANPFLRFIERFYAKKLQSGIRNTPYNFPISMRHYVAIHDAIARKDMSISDLVQPNAPASENNLIIWCRDFYVKSSGDANNYLNYFNTFRDKNYAEIAQIDNTGEVIHNLLINLGTSMESILYNIFVESKPINDMLKPGQAEKPKPIYELKLRPIQDIIRIANILKVKGNENKAWESSNNAKLITLLKNNPKYKNDPAKWAKWFIIVIARRGGANEDKLNDLSSTFSGWWKTEWKNIPYDAEAQIIRELSNLGGRITSTELDKIIKAFNDPKNTDGKNGWLS